MYNQPTEISSMGHQHSEVVAIVTKWRLSHKLKFMTNPSFGLLPDQQNEGNPNTNPPLFSIQKVSSKALSSFVKIMAQPDRAYEFPA